MPKFKSKKPHYEFLHKKWTAKHKHKTDSFIDKHLRNAALSSVGGLLLLTTPAAHIPNNAFAQNNPLVHIQAETNGKILLAEELKKVMPTDVRQLDRDEEEKVAKLIEERTGIKSTGEMEGIRLNRNYGLIGAEQHLYRYPGDTLEAHTKTPDEYAMFNKSGIAPGLGAWGYFAPSKEAFTAEDEQREKYYLAVQTFLAPGFSENVAKYRDFFKYRKMIVVNPKTGQTVVAVVGDAGPGESTGKHLGGSPEVMHELGLGDGPRKGPVIYLFVDDPNNEIPLGPINVKEGKE